MGFLTLDAFKASVSYSLEQRSKAILGADLALSARRSLSEQEILIASETLPKGSVARQERSFFSMAWSGKASRLVEIRAVDAQFPNYGQLELKRAGLVDGQSKKSIIDDQSVWIYPEVSVQLGITIGDNLTLGDASFRVADIIERDPSVSNMGFSPAPKVMIGMKYLSSTGLLGFGSRQEHRWLATLPKGMDAESTSEDLRRALPASDVKIQTHRDASMQISRLLGYLGDYLGLVSLVALFLSAVGTAYLFQSFVDARHKTIATFTALGLSFSKVVQITLIQLLSLGALASVFSLLGCAVILPLLPKALGDLMVGEVELFVGWRSMMLAVLTGLGGALFFSFPSFHRLKSTQPSDLFRETVSVTKSKGRIWTWLPTLFTFWGLAIWQAQSLKVASIFMAIFLMAIFMLYGCGVLSLLGLERLARPSMSWIPRMAILNLCRRRRPARACFLAIGLGAFLLILIPQLAQVMKSELVMEGKNERPSLFLFDIQPEQVEPLQSFIDASPAKIQNMSPLIGARLIKIKGESVNVEVDGFGREAERARNFRNRTLNLSARDGLSSSEKLVSGRDFSGRYDAVESRVVEASLEVRYAQRLGLDLGDHFTIDILGMEVEAEVINLRKVRWTSFQPNFFVVLQPGLLEDAPKTFLASIVDERGVKDLAQLQQQIVSRFSNVGVVDITQTITRLLQVVGQMMFAIQVTAWVSTLAGLGVLFSISRQQLRSRLRDLSLLKLLGAGPSASSWLITTEFTLLGLLAGCSGLLLGLGGSYGLALALFDGSWSMDLGGALWQATGIVVVTVATGYFSSRGSHSPI